MSLVMDFIHTAEGIAEGTARLPIQAAENYSNTFANLGNKLGGGKDQTIQQNMEGDTPLNSALRFSQATGTNQQLGSDVAQVGLYAATPALTGPAGEVADGLTQGAGKIVTGAVKGAAEGAAINAPQAVAQGAGQKGVNAKDLGLDFIQGAATGAAFGGALGGGGAAIKTGIENAKPLNEIGATTAVPGAGSVLPKPSDQIAPEDLQKMAESDDPKVAEKILKPVTGDVLAKEISPAVAATHDPNVAANIIDRTVNNKLTPSGLETAPPSPPPTPLPPITDTSDVNTPAQVAGQATAADQNFMNAPGESRTASSVMQEANPIDKNRSYLQTLQNATTTTPELKEKVSEVEPQTYEQKANQPMMDRAKSLVDTNYDNAVSQVTNNDHLSDEQVAIGHQLLSKAQAEGRMDDAVEIASKLDNSLRSSGREVQAAAIWGRMTPEGMLRHATNVVNKAKEAGKNASLAPEDAQKITDNMEVLRSLPGGTVGDTAKNIRDAVNQDQATPNLDNAKAAVQRTIKEATPAASKAAPKPIEDISTGEKVAERVDKAAQPPQPKPKVDQLVNEITKKVKQEMLEPRPNTPKTPALDILKDVFARNKEAQEAFPEAQQILKDKYADNPEMSDALDKFFNSKLGNPAAGSTFTRAISEQLKENQTKVSQIIAKSWNQQTNSVQEVTDALTKEGFDKDSANAIAKEVTDRMTTQLNEAKTSALNKLAQETPERARPTIIDKIHKLSNLGGLDNSDYLDMARARLGLPELSPEASQRLSELSQQIQDDPNGDSKLVKEVHDIITSSVPSSLGDKAFGVWRAGLLTGPQTVTKIVTSHAVNAVLENAKDVPGAGIDKFLSLFTGQRSLVASLKGSATGFKEGVGAGKNLLANGIDKNPGSNVQDFRLSANFGKSVPGKFMNAYVSGVGRLHGSLYKPFFGMEHLQSLYNQALAAAKTQGLKGEEADRFVTDFVHSPSADALKIAQHDAEMFTFQQTTKLGQIASAMQQKGGIIGKVIAPFTKIPSAIATDLINYSPVGGMKTIIDGIKATKSDEGLTIAAQRQLSQGLGRSIIGTAAIIPGIMLYGRGMITLGYPTTAQEQELWADEGKQPNSVLVDGQWRNLGALGPLGSVLSIGGYMGQALTQGNDLGTAALQGLGGGLKSIESQSYLQGVSSSVDALNQGGSSVNSFAKSTAGSIVPTLSNTVANSTDQYQRNTTGNNIGESMLDAIKGRIPGLRETLPSKTDAFGNNLKSGETGLERIIDPFQSSTAPKSGPLLQELRRLENAGFGEMPQYIDKKENFGTLSHPDYVNLNPQQIKQLTQMIGQATEQAWYQAIETPGYSSLPDVQKQATLSQIYSGTASEEQSIFAQQNNVGPYSPTYTQDLIKSKQKTLTGV